MDRPPEPCRNRLLADPAAGADRVRPFTYQCYSAFAGNPLLIDLELLSTQGLLTPQELHPQHLPEAHVDFAAVEAHHTTALKQAFSRFRPGHDYDAFLQAHADWIDDYALFMALLEHFDYQAWNRWPEPIRRRLPQSIVDYATKLNAACDYHRFVQFCFDTQWTALKTYANANGVRIIGDLPIYVAMNSADVWTHPGDFQLDEALQPIAVSGVPPDYFSATGQLWGNPLFDWEQMEKNGYAWWVQRLEATLNMCDTVRIDHFRGFEAYWSVPADEQTAINGTWVKGPDRKLFAAFEKALGSGLPIIAEDLGVITPEVEKLRDDFGLPGMKILQFAFGSDAANPYLPHHYVRNCVVYSGTHDNDTTNGWFYAEAADNTERRHAMAYLGCGWDAFHLSLNRTALASTANLAVLPLQDILGLGHDARMNTPGTVEGNWAWRVTPQQLDNAPWELLREQCALYGRIVDATGEYDAYPA